MAARNAVDSDDDEYEYEGESQEYEPSQPAAAGKNSGASATAPTKQQEPPMPAVPLSREEATLKAMSLKEQGNKAFTEENWELATALYSVAIETAPWEPTLYGNRSQAFIKAEKFERGAADADKAIELDPVFVKAYLRAGSCYTKLGDFSKARARLAKVRELDLTNVHVAAELSALELAIEQLASARVALDARDPRAALNSYREVQRLAPQAPQVLIGIAEAYILMRNYADAMQMVSSVIRADDQNVEALFVRGVAYQYMDNPEQASNHFRRVLQCDPDHRRAQTALRLTKKLAALKDQGNAHFKAGKNADAITAYSSALEVDPDNAAVNAKLYANRAAALKALGRNSEAVADCTAAVGLDPSYGKAFIRRGDLHILLGQPKEAISDYEAAQALDPENRSIAQALEKAKRELKRLGAIDVYKILGVPRDADEAAIQRAYKIKARETHPDKFPEGEREEAEKRFKLVALAKAILTDPQKRALYDEGHDAADIENGTVQSGMGGMGGFGGHGHGHGGGGMQFDPEMFNMFFGGGGGGRRRGF